VPQQAVTQLQTKYQIAVVNADNTVDMRIVNPGERIDSLWVINEGLRPGDRVIVEGLQKVRQGMKVDPKRSRYPRVSPLRHPPAQQGNPPWPNFYQPAHRGDGDRHPHGHHRYNRMLGLPVASSKHCPPEIQVTNVYRRGRSLWSNRSPPRTADVRRGQHELHVLHQCQ
jgi:hypothetical protein